VKDLAVVGSKVEISAKFGENTRMAMANLSYANENASVKIEIENEDTKFEPTVTAGAVFQSPSRVFWGCNYIYRHKNPSSWDWNAAVLVREENYESYVSLEHCTNKKNDKQAFLTLGWFQKLSDACKVGTSYSIDANNTEGPTLTTAAEYKDAHATYTARFAVKQNPEDNKKS